MPDRLQFPGYSSIDSLSDSLLFAIRTNDIKAWHTLLHLYGPVVYHWCVRAGVPASDAEDLGQEIFLGVAGGLQRFRRTNQQDSFVAWLRTITRNKVADFWRRRKDLPIVVGGSSFQQSLKEIPSCPLKSEPPEIHDDPTDQSIVINQALRLVRPKFHEKTWVAFWQTAVLGRSTRDVALDLEISEMAVRQAKSRVLRQIRDQFAADD